MPDVSTANLTITARVAVWSARHRWWVLGAAVAVIALAFVGIIVVGADTRGGSSTGESGAADDLIDERFNSAPDPDEVGEPIRRERVIFSNPSLGVSDPDFEATVLSVVEELREDDTVKTIVSFYESGESALVAEDNNAVLIIVDLHNTDGLTWDDIEVGPLLEIVEDAAAEADGFEIAVFSSNLLEDQLEEIITEDFSRILIYSLVIGLVILIFAFGAPVAAVVPLVMALGSIFTALGIAALVSQAFPLVDLYAEILLLMGLAVGIDYSLFIISRFRSERAGGREKMDAIAVASNTTGRAVFYAGITVILSLAGLTLTRDLTFISLSLGAVIVVFVSTIASLTLLPALLAVLGNSVNWLRIPFLSGPSDSGDSGSSGGSGGSGNFWGAITDRVLARPVVLAMITAAALIVLAIPAGSLNLGFNVGANSLPDAAEGKRAAQLVEQHFSGSLILPARIVIDAPDVAAPGITAAVESFNETIEASDAFLGVAGSNVNDAGDLMVIRVTLAGNIDDDESNDAVRLLREQIIPEAFAGTGAGVYVTGDTADGLDFTDRMYSSAVWVFLFVLGLSFLLMLVMFRSIVIPLKAIALNLLSVAAVYGVLVAVFQWGWGISVFGSEATGVIEAWLPLFLFGILFGLSMDYHMLVLNRIKEDYDHTGNTEHAISMGVRLTAGQITSAALIMVGVFATFATSRILGLQQFGVGLAVAVFIDATVIRVILLPASMKLLGDSNWYLPSWLDWLPKVAPGED
jgi:putative drug exporter of the RND superfamily